MVDEESGGRFARMTGCKGLGEHGSMDWLLQEISRTWKSWGHTGGPEQQLIVKSDGEPALVAVCEAAIKYHGGKAVQERPAKGQKAENGLIEAAGKDTRELFCSFLTQVEEGTKESLPLDNNLVPWMIRWAAICYSRYAMGRDGRTAFERIRGRSCRAVVVPIGEKVWFKRTRETAERKDKAESEWFIGIWLGPALISSETLIGTKDGVVRASSIKRSNVQEKWNMEDIKAMQGTPQRPDPNKPGTHIPTRIRMEPEVDVEVDGSRPARREEGPRSTYLKKEAFEKYKYTEGCEGCRRLQAGVARNIVHKPECRERMYKAMSETPEGRKWLEKADRRINEYMEEKHDEETQEQAKRARLENFATEETNVNSKPDPVAPSGGRVELASRENQSSSSNKVENESERGEREREVQLQRGQRWKDRQKEYRLERL